MKFYGLQGWVLERTKEDDDAKAHRQASRKASQQRYQNAQRQLLHQRSRAPWLLQITKEEKVQEQFRLRQSKREAKFDAQFGGERRFWRSFAYSRKQTIPVVDRIVAKLPPPAQPL